MILLGHVDSGKSTLLGRLIVNTGGVEPKAFEEISKYALKIGKGSFRFAFLTDTLYSEQERGLSALLLCRLKLFVRQLISKCSD